MRLSELPRQAQAVVDGVDADSASDAVARRLTELGFVPGETVRLLTTAPFGGDPVLVQVGFTRFALRRAEAARVRVSRQTMA